MPQLNVQSQNLEGMYTSITAVIKEQKSFLIRMCPVFVSELNRGADGQIVKKKKGPNLKLNVKTISHRFLTL